MSSLRILVVCTGNVARSPMLATMIDDLAEGHGLDWTVRSAGTLAGAGDRVGPRTLAALASVGAATGLVHRHRSRRLDESDRAWADVIVTVEASHVRSIRLVDPAAGAYTVSLAQLVLDWPEGQSLVERVRTVAASEPLDSLDVVDPAGADQSTYDETARTLWRLARAFVARVGG